MRASFENHVIFHHFTHTLHTKIKMFQGGVGRLPNENCSVKAKTLLQAGTVLILFWNSKNVVLSQFLLWTMYHQCELLRNVEFQSPTCYCFMIMRDSLPLILFIENIH